jgi:hypothetical protein
MTYGVGAFDTEAVAAMSQAFDGAVKELHDSGQRVLPETIATRIVAAAKFGERNPVRLREAALAGPSREDDCRTWR